MRSEIEFDDKNVKIVKLLLLQSSIYVSKHNDGHSQEKMYKMF